jgi:hypothetical protein
VVVVVVVVVVLSKAACMARCGADARLPAPAMLVWRHARATGAVRQREEAWETTRAAPTPHCQKRTAAPDALFARRSAQTQAA